MDKTARGTPPSFGKLHKCADSSVLEPTAQPAPQRTSSGMPAEMFQLAGSRLALLGCSVNQLRYCVESLGLAVLIFIGYSTRGGVLVARDTC